MQRSCHDIGSLPWSLHYIYIQPGLHVSYLINLGCRSSFYPRLHVPLSSAWTVYPSLSSPCCMIPSLYPWQQTVLFSPELHGSPYCSHWHLFEHLLLALTLMLLVAFCLSPPGHLLLILQNLPQVSPPPESSP